MNYRRLSFTKMPILLVSIFSGCAAHENYDVAIQSWEGAPATEMLEVWGEPDRVRDMSDLASSLGASIAYFEWLRENRSEAEQAEIDDTSTTAQKCSGKADRWGNVNVTCNEQDGTDFGKLGYKLGAGPRMYCRTTAKITDGRVVSVESEGNLCAMSEKELARYARD